MDRRTFLQGMAAAIGGVFTADLHRRFGTLELPGQEPVEIAAETITDPTPAGSWLYWSGQVYPAENFMFEFRMTPIDGHSDLITPQPYPHKYIATMQASANGPLTAKGAPDFGLFGVFSDYRVLHSGRLSHREEINTLLVGFAAIDEDYDAYRAMSSHLTFTTDTQDDRIVGRDPIMRMRQYDSVEAARRAFQDVQAFEAENG